MKLKELKNTGNNKLSRVYNILMRKLNNDFIPDHMWYYMTYEDRLEKYEKVFEDMELNDILTYFGEKEMKKTRGFGKNSLSILKELSTK